MRGVVCLIDDDAAVQRGVSVLLTAAGYDSSVYGSAEEFLGALPDLDRANSVILVDVCMPGMQGPQLQSRLKADGVAIPLIIMTAHGDIPMATRAMREGAVDFLEKPFTAEELTLALDRAFALSNSHSRVRASAPEDAAQRVNALTPREREVLVAIVDGQSSKLIGRELGLSPRTVEVHRRNIMTKMKASSFAELIRMAVAADLDI
ncbi:MAG: response regulator transcription factor [Pseudomonadota bacterium]